MTTSSVTNNNGGGGGGGQANSTRNCSPDTDSAFCDNLSVLSSCSASSGEKKGGGGSSGHSSGGSNHAVDEDARIKAEKIKLAIEKIKEASVKKLFIKVELYRYYFTVSSILENIILYRFLRCGSFWL
jgi:hypothetical protein